MDLHAGVGAQEVDVRRDTRHHLDHLVEERLAPELRHHEQLAVDRPVGVLVGHRRQVIVTARVRHLETCDGKSN